MQLNAARCRYGKAKIHALVKHLKSDVPMIERRIANQRICLDMLFAKYFLPTVILVNKTKAL